jgi:DNA polymerase III subunit epsilon
MPLALLVKDTPLTAIDFESIFCNEARTTIPTQIGTAQAQGKEIIPSSFYTKDLKTVTTPNFPQLLDLWPQLEPQLRGRYLIAHGRGIEKRFLSTFPLHRFGPWVDTLQLSRKLLPELPSHQLSEVIIHLGLLSQLITLFPRFRWHDALSDAIAALLLFKTLINQFNLGETSIEHFIS